MAKPSSTWDGVFAEFRPLTIALGEVGYAYNRLQEQFFNVFLHAFALERRRGFAQQLQFYPYVLALWHTIPNDRAQRDLAVTAMAKLPTSLSIKEGIERLEWAKKKTDRLAEYRNLIIHTPVDYWPKKITYPVMKKMPTLVPKIGGISTKPSNLSRLGHIKDLSFWKALRNDFLNLNEFVDWTNRQILSREYEREHGPVAGASRAWPHRPRLPCVRRIDSIELAAKIPTKPVRKYRRQRRPSRGQPQV
jgi:hypothetical protein